MNKIVFSVFVDNTSGVLSRVAGLEEALILTVLP